jgi:uncharacterized protein YqgC (DUF456 family)
MEILEVATIIICSLTILSGLVLGLIGLPGIWLIFASYLATAIILGTEVVPVWLIIIVLIVSIGTSVIDNVISIAWVKKSGASNWALLGAVLGGIVGLIIGNIAGVIVGPFIGAFVLELVIEKKSFQMALKAGFSAFIGWILGIVLKFGVTVLLSILWLFIVI